MLVTARPMVWPSQSLKAALLTAEIIYNTLKFWGKMQININLGA
jgi:hypothetical protein